MKICPKCGKPNDEMNSVCDNCGYTFESSSYSNDVQHYNTQKDQYQRTNSLAVASLVLGIIGIVFLCCYNLGTIPGILAVVFGVISRKDILNSGGREKGLGMSTAGLVLGIITVAFAIITVVIIAFSSASLVSFYDDIYKSGLPNYFA